LEGLPPAARGFFPIKAESVETSDQAEEKGETEGDLEVEPSKILSHSFAPETRLKIRAGQSERVYITPIHNKELGLA